MYEDPESNSTFWKLHKRMQAEYNSETSCKFKINSVREGMPLAAFFAADQNWHRAEILRVIPNSLTCEVLFVDYGDVHNVPIHHIRYLKSEFFVHEVLVRIISIDLPKIIEINFFYLKDFQMQVVRHKFSG